MSEQASTEESKPTSVETSAFPSTSTFGAPSIQEPSNKPTNPPSNTEEYKLTLRKKVLEKDNNYKKQLFTALLGRHTLLVKFVISRSNPQSDHQKIDTSIRDLYTRMIKESVELTLLIKKCPSTEETKKQEAQQKDQLFAYAKKLKDIRSLHPSLTQADLDVIYGEKKEETTEATADVPMTENTTLPEQNNLTHFENPFNSVPENEIEKQLFYNNLTPLLLYEIYLILLTTPLEEEYTAFYEEQNLQEYERKMNMLDANSRYASALRRGDSYRGRGRGRGRGRPINMVLDNRSREIKFNFEDSSAVTVESIRAATLQFHGVHNIRVENNQAFIEFDQPWETKKPIKDAIVINNVVCRLVVAFISRSTSLRSMRITFSLPLVHRLLLLRRRVQMMVRRPRWNHPSNCCFCVSLSFDVILSLSVACFVNQNDTTIKDCYSIRNAFRMASM